MDPNQDTSARPDPAPGRDSNPNGRDLAQADSTQANVLAGLKTPDKELANDSQPAAKADPTHAAKPTIEQAAERESPAVDSWSWRNFFTPTEYLRSAREMYQVAKDSRDVFKLVWSPAKEQILKSAALTIGSSLTPAIQGGALALAISAVESKSNTHAIVALTAIIGSHLLQTIIGRRQTEVNSKLNIECTKAVEEKILGSMNALPGEVIDSQDTQKQLGFAQDSPNLPASFISNAVTSAATSIALIGGSAAVFSISPGVGVITLATGLPLLIAAKQRTTLWADYQENSKESNMKFWIRRWQLLTPGRVKESQMIGATDRMATMTIEQLEKVDRHHLDTIKQSLYIDKVPTYLQFVTNGGALGYCLYSALNGTISLPQFSFVTGALVGLTATISALSSSIGSQLEGWQKLKPLLEFIDEGKGQRIKVEARTNEIDWSTPPKIEFKDVSLKYKGQEEFALRNVSFVIEPGESVLLVGENGAGKSSLMKLLSGVYSPTSGTILINGVDLKTISKKSWHQGYAILSQDSDLFYSYTTGENLELGKDMDGNGIEPAVIIDRFNLRQVIGGDDPLNKNIGEGFDNTFIPSGGERKVFGIARSHIKSPKVVVYDEPTAGLDGDKEEIILPSILGAKSDQTRILITHDYLQGLDCDKVIELRKGGEIVAVGTPSELLEREDTLVGRRAKKARDVVRQVDERIDELKKELENQPDNE